jgi:hypothetical protein
MERKEYNGWTNYETWVVKLWIDNEEGSYHYWQEEVETVCRRNVHRDTATNTLRGLLEDYHRENMPEVTGTYADLLGASLSEVNWYEIAEHLVDDYASDNPEVFETEEEES